MGVFFYFYAASKPLIPRNNMVFFHQIMVVGMIYLLSDPFTIVSSFLLDEWNRQYYYRVIDQTVHAVTQGYILWQMRNKKSSFNKSVNEFTSLPTSSGN